MSNIIYPTKDESLKGKKARYKEGTVLQSQDGKVKYQVQKDGSYRKIAG